jgi:hypothetical protein
MVAVQQSMQAVPGLGGSWNSELKYTAFGEMRASNGLTPTEYRYTGRLEHIPRHTRTITFQYLTIWRVSLCQDNIDRRISIGNLTHTVQHIRQEVPRLCRRYLRNAVHAATVAEAVASDEAVG